MGRKKIINGKVKALIFIFFGAALAAFLLFVGCNMQNNKKTASNQFCLMTTTDRHANIWDEDLLKETSINNSMLNEATAVDEIRQQYDDRTILFDNGDLFQGNLMSTANIVGNVAGARDEVNPCAICLEELDYDGYTLGNHEFNYNWDFMKKTYDTLGEAGIPCICCNIYKTSTGQRVFAPYMLKTLNIDGEDFTVCIIGMENTEITSWDLPSKYPDMQFYAPENTNRDLTYELQKVQAEMKAAGVNPDMTIVSMHSGAFPETFNKGDDFDYVGYAQNAARQPLQAGINTENQALRLMENSTGVDIVVHGHDHVDYISNMYFKNAEGKDVLSINAAKTSMSKTCITVNKDENGKLKAAIDSSDNVDLSKYKVDEDLKEKIEPYYEEAKADLEYEVGVLDGNWENNQDIKAADVLVKQTDSMDLINRSIMWKADQGLATVYKSTTELNNKLKSLYGQNTKLKVGENNMKCDLGITSFTCDATLKTGELIFQNIRQIYRFENTISSMAVNGQWIKDLLENNSTYFQKTADGWQVENSKRYVCPVTFGLNFTYDMSRPEGDRVQIEGFSNGRKFDVNDTYLIAIPDYYVSNSNNPILGQLSTSNLLWSQTETDGFGDGPTAILEYVWDVMEKYGAVYPTSEIEKNGLTASHWSIKN